MQFSAQINRFHPVCHAAIWGSSEGVLRWSLLSESFQKFLLPQVSHIFKITETINAAPNPNLGRHHPYFTLKASSFRSCHSVSIFFSFFFLSVVIFISCLMGNQKCALWESLEHCVSSLWVCLLPFKSRTFGTVCIDKTHEYLSRAIYHLTPLAPPSYTKAIFTHISHSLSVVYTQLCTQIYLECQQCDFICCVWSVSSHPTLCIISSPLHLLALILCGGGDF